MESGACGPASVVPGTRVGRTRHRRRAVAQAVKKVVAALDNTLIDDRGRWILASDHHDGHSELAIAGEIDGAIAHLSIDRCFRDAEGNRWIVDFKTGVHEGADLDAFLDREVERYRPQLERYAELISRVHPGEPLRTGLYFPLHQAWRSWTPLPAQSEPRCRKG